MKIESAKKVWDGKAWETVIDGKVVYAWCDKWPDLKDGQEVDGTIVDSKGKNYLMPAKKGGGKFGGGGMRFPPDEMERAKYPSFALSYAKDLAVARMAGGVTVNIADMLTEADTLLSWLQSKGGKTTTRQPQAPATAPATDEELVMRGDDDKEIVDVTKEAMLDGACKEAGFNMRDLRLTWLTARRDAIDYEKALKKKLNARGIAVGLGDQP